MNYIMSFNRILSSDFSLVGGKAANLAVMVQASLPVPPGFCLTTEAYRRFIAHNDLQGEIESLLPPSGNHDYAAYEEASAKIRDLFHRGKIPQEIIDELEAAYTALIDSDLSDNYVAVRSSATAEDLPDMSFAGQQDTYLNILGMPSLLSSVVKCWSSLWTSRAISYREKNKVNHSDVALAVVVQQMIESESSGVLFTVNPLTGRRREIVIDATIGLGEALVSGQVEPDHYVVERIPETITKRILGSKAVNIRTCKDGGTVQLAEDGSEVQALTDAQIIELVRLSKNIEQLFRAPQDIEWAYAQGEFYILQSRAITSLYPLPQKNCSANEESEEKVWYSFASWQGMVEPFTPLGQDFIKCIAVGVANQLGFRKELATQNIFESAGERLFVNITPLMRSKNGRKIILKVLSEMDLDAHSSLQELQQHMHFKTTQRKTETFLLGRVKLFFTIISLFAQVVRNFLNPTTFHQRIMKEIELVIDRSKKESMRNMTPIEQISWTESLTVELSRILVKTLLPGTLSGHLAIQSLMRLSAKGVEEQRDVLELTRSLPHNVTSEMDLDLWGAASEIKGNKAAYAAFIEKDGAQLAFDYLEQRFPASIQARITAFLEQYGVRGIAEIDIGRQRWSENPTPVMQVLKSYLQLEETTSPMEVYREGKKIAAEAEYRLIQRIKVKRGKLAGALARFLVKRVRFLAGFRETPKFTVVRLMAIIRSAWLELGEVLKQRGVLNSKDDVFYLQLSELKGLVTQVADSQEVMSIIVERREKYERELRRTRVPRLLFSDGTAVYTAQTSASPQNNAIVGNPVSPGVVEGVIRVVIDPHNAKIEPGEILVCPATDPAWTPLFLVAGGLIMEIGGMMTHGSVVAREYGIPAVTGINQATEIFKSGQRIRLDGSSGLIQIL